MHEITLSMLLMACAWLLILACFIGVSRLLLMDEEEAAKLIDKLFQTICYLFHQKSWKVIGEYSNEWFEYDKIECSKCKTVFYDAPFDPDD